MESLQSTQKLLSVIIPVKNWDVGLLLDALLGEIISSKLEDHVEIIIADDCSKEQYRRMNRAHVQQKDCIFYYERKQCMGRAAIRNDLLKKASGTYILFLDADVLPDNPDFLKTYLTCVRENEPVVCGGVSYRNRTLLEKKYDFYLYKGKHTEWLPVEKRQQAAWRYFFSANVLIKRSILERISFDERFSGYGYEDIEWGIRLDKACGIHQIENTCSHLGLIEKQKAFSRMRSSIENFLLLQELHPNIFHQTGVAPVAEKLKCCPSFLLRSMDALCSACFALSPWHKISLLFFQMDKAVLLALAGRKIREKI
ncbi:MAG TPA: glycosyltransferase family 2 protein [Desulfobulbus sp.]|nr:glycosyltransferase family 2 protein [Desulfobulbus sp.]